MNQLKNWFISYEPYSDVFQFYDEIVFRTKDSLLSEEKTNDLRFVSNKKDKRVVLIEVKNAYDKFRIDIDNSEKSSIIDRVLEIVDLYDKQKSSASQIKSSLKTSFFGFGW